MSPPDDAYFEMADLGPSWPRQRFFDPLALDEGTASRILDGLGQADVPPGYVGLARLLAAASAPAHADELEGEAAVIAAFVGEPAPTIELPIHTVELPIQRAELRSGRRRRAFVRGLATQKVAVAAVAGGLVVGGGVAAAATGSLPGAAQGVASRVLGFVGVDVPGPNSDARHHPDTRGSSGAAPPTVANAPTSANPGPTSCIAPCGAQLPLGANGSPSVAGSGAAVTTPNQGGTGTATTASKGASSAGTTRADEASGEASSAGSGNAGSHSGPGPASGSNGGPGSGGASGGASNAGSGNAGSGSGGSGNGGASNGGSGNAGSHPGAEGANSSSQGQAHGKP